MDNIVNALEHLRSSGRGLRSSVADIGRTSSDTVTDVGRAVGQFVLGRPASSRVAQASSTSELITSVSTTVRETHTQSDKEEVVEKTESLHAASQANDSTESDGSVVEHISYQPIAELGKVSGTGTYKEAIAVALKSIAGVTVRSAEEINQEQSLMEEPNKQAPPEVKEELQSTQDIVEAGNEALSSAMNLTTGNTQIVSNTALRMASTAFLSMETSGTLFTQSPISRELGQVKTSDYYSTQTRGQVAVNRTEHIYESGDTRHTSNRSNTVISTERNSTVAKNIGRTASQSTTDTSDLYNNQSTTHNVLATETISQSSQGNIVQQAKAEHVLAVGSPSADVNPAFISLPSLGSSGASPQGFIRKIVGGVSSTYSQSDNSVTGAMMSTVFGDSRNVTSGDAVNLNDRFAELSQKLRVDGLGDGLASIVTSRGRFSMKGWASKVVPSVIQEVSNCISLPKLPPLPDIELPFDISGLNCQDIAGQESETGERESAEQVDSIEDQVRDGANGDQQVLGASRIAGPENPIPAGIASDETASSSNRTETKESPKESVEVRRRKQSAAAIAASGSFGHPTGVYVDRYNEGEKIEPENPVSNNINQPITIPTPNNSNITSEDTEAQQEKEDEVKAKAEETTSSITSTTTTTTSSIDSSISSSQESEANENLATRLGTDFGETIYLDGEENELSEEHKSLALTLLNQQNLPNHIALQLSTAIENGTLESTSRNLGLSKEIATSLTNALKGHLPIDPTDATILDIVNLVPGAEDVIENLNPEALLQKVEDLISDLPILDELDNVLSLFGISTQEGLSNLFEDLTNCADKFLQFDNLLNKKLLDEVGIDIETELGKIAKDVLDRIPEGLAEDLIGQLQNGIDIDDVLGLASKYLKGISVDLDILDDWSLCGGGEDSVEGQIQDVISSTIG